MAFDRRVTIKQVAKEAGVSPQTVSRVVNNHPDVSTDTRERVQQVINRLAYSPSLVARTLLNGRSRTLGVVGSGLELFGPSHTLVGIEKQAESMGYALHLTLVQQPEKSDATLLRRLLSYQVDGVIWAVPEIGDNRSWVKPEVAHFVVPMVFLSMRPDPALSVVAVDNREGGRLATAHLISQGCRKIGLITGPRRQWEAHQRRLGWETALRAAGLEPTEEWVVEGDWTPASGEQGLLKLVEQRPDVEAVFVCNDQMAVGALQAARHLGRRIPADLAIVGFDDVPECAYFHPPLSTIRQDMVEVGSCAVRELCRVIEASQQSKTLIQPRTILIQPQLIVRQSSGVQSAPDNRGMVAPVGKKETR